MASHAATTASTAATFHPPSSILQDVEAKIPLRKKLDGFMFSSPFTIFSDSSPTSAGVRIVGTLERFSTYYAIFIWIALFITLVQKQKLSMIYLFATSYMILVYFAFLHLLPDLITFYKQVGTLSRLLFVLVLFSLVGSITVLGLALTEGETLLFVALAAMMPIAGLYAALSTGGDEAVDERFALLVVSCAESLV